ncbi:MAG: glutamate--tRNA ligase family protein [Bacteroidota bacterium]
MSIFSRIAPTPSGYLHIGNLYSFYITVLLTREVKGKLHLRIDDLDKERARQEFIEDIFDSLRFMGFSYDSGPLNSQEFYSKYSQQFRLDNYNDILSSLVNTGLVYACTCSRKRTGFQQSSHPSCHCRTDNKSLDTPYACWRIYVPPNTSIIINDKLMGKKLILLDLVLGDFVVKRRDGVPAYQVASLSDDLYYGINLVVRGEDLLASTAAQLYLSHCLKNESFSNTIFFHHALIRNAEGIKLSKSAGASSIKHLRNNGACRNGIIQIFDSTPGILTPKELVAQFKRINVGISQQLK